ncbi:MAG: phage head closure protein [Candidatus Paceibacterota bacterium]|jgi:SPP1 family predicted phage head-tail adaptor
MIPAGSLDRLITIQYPPSTKNDYGEVNLSAGWTQLDQVWSRIEYMGGSEAVEGGKVTALNKIVFIVRYRTDIAVNMRVSYESKYYYIQFIEEIERREGLRLICEVRD